MNRFWILWSPTGNRPPSRRHHSFEEAERVAREMADKHPGQEFFVMAACSLSRKVTVETIRMCCGDDGIPF